jgi:cysteine/O-acetylserine efflux protein
VQWTAFFTYILITSHTPGPNIVLAMNSARLHGFRRTLPLIAGMVSGLLIIMICCALFNLLLARLLPSFLPVLRLAGATYILWLAWKIAFPKRTHAEGSQNAEEVPPFRQGLILQFLNPKVILFGLTTLSTFIVPWTSSKLWLFGCGIFIALTCSNGVLLWSLVGAAQKKILAHQGRFLDLLMGGLLAWCAFSVSGIPELFSR